MQCCFFACQSDDDDYGDTHESSQLIGTYWYLTDELYVDEGDTSSIILFPFNDVAVYYYHSYLIQFTDSTYTSFYGNVNYDAHVHTIEYIDSLYYIDNEEVARNFDIIENKLYIPTYATENDTTYFLREFTRYKHSFPPVSWIPLDEIIDDGYEDNNFFDSATPIEVGDTLFDHNLTQDDIDYFEFNLEEGKTYKIHARKPFGSMVHNLYNSSQNIVCLDLFLPMEEGDLACNRRSGIIFNCNETGSYYCKITNTSAENTYYYFYVEETDLEAPELP